jgi:hypothetical protein
MTIAAVVIAGIGSLTTTAPTSAAAARPDVHRVSSHYLLTHLPVHAAHYGGYLRSKFTLWTEHADGCNTRYKVLFRDAVVKPTVEAGCYLANGKWVSPYDGFTTTNPTKLQVDHVVPLAAAWGAGAYRWNSDTRKRFANDLGTSYDLIAVSSHSNESKGDDGPDQYLPPRSSFDCRYMADYTAVLWRWHLSIDRAEKSFLSHHLAQCGWPKIAEPSRPRIGLGSSKPPPRKPLHPHACTKTSTGKCIRAGEFCAKADYGQSGYDGDGHRLTCTGSRSHPHWESS